MMAFARVLLASEESATAYQIEVSTNRLILQGGSSAPEFLMGGTKSFGDHPVFFGGDIRATRTAKIEDAIRVDVLLRTGEIASDQATNVFSQRYAEVTCALACASLYLSFQGDLSTGRHDGTIVTHSGGIEIPVELDGAHDSNA